MPGKNMSLPSGEMGARRRIAQKPTVPRTPADRRRVGKKALYTRAQSHWEMMLETLGNSCACYAPWQRHASRGSFLCLHFFLLAAIAYARLRGG